LDDGASDRGVERRGRRGGWLRLTEGEQRRRRFGPRDHLQQAKAEAKQSDEDRHGRDAQRIALQPRRVLSATAAGTARAAGVSFEFLEVVAAAWKGIWLAARSHS
jgi:hypothetical protein